MELLTFQDKRVLECLLAGRVYFADISRASANLIKPYEYMRDFYKWESCPVFCMPCGSNGTRYGGCSKEGVLLGLDVPKDIVRLQYYYDWTDVIYFTEFPEEFADTFDTNVIPTLNDYADLVMTGVDQGSYNIFQATIPCIKPEWLVESLEDEAQIRDILSKIERETVPYLKDLGLSRTSETAFFS